MSESIAEKLLRARAATAAEMCGRDGMPPEHFNRAWNERLEPLFLAKLHADGETQPAPRPLKSMPIAERAELRAQIGNEAYVKRIQQEGGI